MPFASRLAPPTLSRLVVLAVFTTGLLGTTTGIASATTTAPPSGSSPTTTDPGTPTSGDPTTTPTAPVTDPTITFSLPTAAAHLRTASQSRHARVQARHAREVRSVIRIAREQRGKPYVYGGAGPRSFDCSGLTRYVFGHAIGRWLPHNAEAQYRSVQHIKRRNVQVGDLVFQESGGYAFHVGIYAGHGKWWHAPHSGARVHEQKIYSGHKFYGRVLTTRPAKHRKR